MHSNQRIAAGGHDVLGRNLRLVHHQFVAGVPRGDLLTVECYAGSLGVHECDDQLLAVMGGHQDARSGLGLIDADLGAAQGVTSFNRLGGAAGLCRVVVVVFLKCRGDDGAAIGNAWQPLVFLTIAAITSQCCGGAY